MHAKNIVHLDLKPENLMIDADFNLKVSDFGAAITKNVECIRQYSGSRTYMAPEIS
jgi:3-phosphoinositide dependent protein kinase-1